MGGLKWQRGRSEVRSEVRAKVEKRDRVYGEVRVESSQNPMCVCVCVQGRSECNQDRKNDQERFK